MLRDYHYAWLSVHPDWDEDSLQIALSMGFDIHHEDGNHSNNDPSNLLLVEHQDHMRLHGRQPLHKKLENGKLQQKIEKGHSCYVLREQRLPWHEVAQRVYGVRMSQKAMNAAKKYAEYHNQPWPIDVGNCAGIKYGVEI